MLNDIGKVFHFSIFLPSDKSGTPHFHQFGELAAEKRFFNSNLITRIE